MFETPASRAFEITEFESVEDLCNNCPHSRQLHKSQDVGYPHGSSSANPLSTPPYLRESYEQMPCGIKECDCPGYQELMN